MRHLSCGFGNVQSGIIAGIIIFPEAGALRIPDFSGDARTLFGLGKSFGLLDPASESTIEEFNTIWREMKAKGLIS